MTRDDVCRTLEETIGPFIGRHMAKAAVELHAKKLSPGSVGEDACRTLLDDVARGMVVFVGKDKAAELTRKAAAAIGLPPR